MKKIKKWLFYKMLNYVTRQARKNKLVISMYNPESDMLFKSELSSQIIIGINENLDRGTGANAITDYENICSYIEDEIGCLNLYQTRDSYRDKFVFRQILLAIDREEEIYIKLAYERILASIRENEYKIFSKDATDLKQDLLLLKILAHRLKNKKEG